MAWDVQKRSQFHLPEPQYFRLEDVFGALGWRCTRRPTQVNESTPEGQALQPEVLYITTARVARLGLNVMPQWTRGVENTDAALLRWYSGAFVNISLYVPPWVWQDQVGVADIDLRTIERVLIASGAVSRGRLFSAASLHRCDLTQIEDVASGFLKSRVWRSIYESRSAGGDILAGQSLRLPFGLTLPVEQDASQQHTQGSIVTAETDRVWFEWGVALNPDRDGLCGFVALATSDGLSPKLQQKESELHHTLATWLDGNGCERVEYLL